MSIHQSECDQTTTPTPTQVGHRTDQSGADNSSPEPCMIGDFDGSANALWTLYGKVAKSHDKSRIQTLKDDMDGVLIFIHLHFICAHNGLGQADA